MARSPASTAEALELQLHVDVAEVVAFGLEHGVRFRAFQADDLPVDLPRRTVRAREQAVRESEAQGRTG